MVSTRRVLAACFVLPLWSCLACVAQSAKPVITKIDPPNWFTHVPDSLLLVHGEHLENTRFTAHGHGARIAAASSSKNGHWAFLTLVTKSARAGQVKIVAANARGKTQFAYQLNTRRSEAQQPKGFSSADVMYLIMPDRFADGDATNDDLSRFHEKDDRSLARAYHGGDLKGIQQHLDYLKKLGVNTIWTTPLYDNSANQSGQTYHGYSATDMYAVDPHFGTIADYRSLVTEAHAHGLKVVLDTVPNHVGPKHPWVNDEPTQDWFHGTAQSHIKVDDDFSSVTDPNASAARRDVLLNGWFADVLPDMNEDNPLVAKYLIQNAIWWIESAGIDGLRIDTFPYVPRRFWHEYDAELHAFYPHIAEVGEVFNADPHVTSFFAGGRSNTGSDGTFDTLLDTPFDYPMFFALRGALTHHKPMTAISDVLQQDVLYPHPERLVIFLGNHDTKRFLSEPGANPQALRIGFGLLATLRGMPQLYYGDEIEMTGGDDPQNRKDFPGGFPGDAANAFTGAGLSADARSMQDWVRSLIQLRDRTPELQTGKLRTLLANDSTLAFVRAMQTGTGCSTAPTDVRYLVVVNNSMQGSSVDLLTAGNALAGCNHFSAAVEDGASATLADGKLEAHLPAQTIGIFRVQR
jgi:glycosidase